MYYTADCQQGTQTTTSHFQYLNHTMIKFKLDVLLLKIEYELMKEYSVEPLNNVKPLKQPIKTKLLCQPMQLHSPTLVTGEIRHHLRPPASD